MIRVSQQGDSDCFPACLASILELSLADVPHYKERDEWIESYRAFLEPYGLSIEMFASEKRSPRGYCIVSLWKSRGDSHACVMKDGEIVHDPATQDLTWAKSAAVRKYYVLTALDAVKWRRV